MSLSSRIAKILVSRVDEAGNLADKVAVESFWKDSPCFIIFFRRFGWQFCRLAAKDLSASIKPKLDAKNIRFIGVGFDEKFLKPFVEGKFFDGELYIDANKECYNALQYQRFGFIDLMKLMFSSKWRQAIARAKTLNVGGDMKGDGFQNGGALVLDKNGKVLLDYRQEDAADHVNEKDVLKALGIASE